MNAIIHTSTPAKSTLPTVTTGATTAAKKEPLIRFHAFLGVSIQNRLLPPASHYRQSSGGTPMPNIIDMVVEMRPYNPTILSTDDTTPICNDPASTQRVTSLQDVPLVLCIEDLMAVLSIGRNTAYELVRSGQIRSIRVGKNIRIPRNAVEEFLKK